MPDRVSSSGSGLPRVGLWLAFIALFVAVSGGIAAPTPAEQWLTRTESGQPRLHLYFFWTQTCPHCRQARPVIEALAADYPWLELHSHEITHDMAGALQYTRMAEALGQTAQSVPAFLFCGQMITGFDRPETTGQQLRQQLQDCHRRWAKPDAAIAETAIPSAPVITTPLQLPLFGTVDPNALSLPVLTVTLAGLDAFNPCAFFVLLFLLSLLVHARDRRRMLLIGGVFVFCSGLIYFVFMAAWLNVFLIAGELRIITALAGLVALLVAALNIKDYFWFRAGPSLSIPESAKPGLFRRMRAIVAAGSLGPMLASTVLLAIVANSYELLCTAGFPMVYTRALTLAGLETWQYYAWLAAYNVIYVLPLLVIVFVFVRTMGSRKLTESEGRVLKLVSGFMMLGFGLMLLLAPNLLTNALASILILLAAVAVAAIVAKLATPRIA